MSAQDNNRFYQGYCEPFAHEPTRDKFKIVETGEQDEGVVSLSRFEPGDVVFAFCGDIVDTPSMHTMQVGTGRHLLDTRFLWKVLHSCEPNMRCDVAKSCFYACKRIEPGQFISFDYETTEDLITSRFTCKCGAPACRSNIVGKEIKEA